MRNPHCVFRGSRTYLHSTSLLNHILSKLDYEPRDIDFVFHKETANLCKIENQAPADESQLIASYKDRKSRLYIVECGDPILERTPYDETVVVSDSTIDENRIAFPGLKPAYTFCECLIAGYKHLLENIFPEQTRKYAFARLRLAIVPDGGFEIAHSRIIASKFYQGDITVDGQGIGNIYFGIW